MSVEESTHVGAELFAWRGAGADPDDIAALFSTDVAFEIPGDVGALPQAARP